MGEVIARGNTGAGRYSVVAFGPWLDVLEANSGRAARNNLLRLSLQDAGFAWCARFLGRRFTNYVKGAPFFYRLGLGGAVRKFRRMGLLDTILKQETHGWDPWSSTAPPKELIADYRRQHPEARGVFSRSGNYLTLSKTIRKLAKDGVRRYVDQMMASKLRPLVETGVAEKTARAGRRAVATVTKARSRLNITIPFGGPRNPLVGRIVRTLPSKEVETVARDWAVFVSNRLRGTGLQAFVRGDHTPAPAVED